MSEFKILRTWEIETNINCLLHSKSSEYYSKLNIIFMIPIIMLSSSTGTLGLMNTNTSQMIITNDINVMSLIVGIFGLLSAMLTTIHNFLGVQKLQSTHNFHSTEYNKISREIKMHIYLSETDVRVYANIAEYIKQRRSKIDKLIETSPNIPNHIENKLQHKIKLIRCDRNNELNEIISLKKSQGAKYSSSYNDNAMCSSNDTSFEFEKKNMTEVIMKTNDQNEGVSVNIVINDKNTSDNMEKIESISPVERSSIDVPTLLLSREDSFKQIKYYFSSIDDDE